MVEPYAGAAEPVAPAQGRHGRAQPARPTAVVVVAVLTFVQAAGALLSAIATYVAVRTLEDDSPFPEGFDEVDEDFAVDEGFDEGGESYVQDDGGTSLVDLELLLVVGLPAVVLGALLVLFGVMLLRGRLWAAVGLTVLQLLVIAGSFVRLFATADPTAVVILAMPIAVITCLWATSARRWVRRKPRPTAP
jgi:hypothetical protein